MMDCDCMCFLFGVHIISIVI
uniref:Uncharacterized protein n=1 Tax=Anguilla anguilla TaxID=7936 RepID=A0A0E9P8W2_ANGAN